jgi:predicted nucleic acid-binding protein
VKNQSEFEKLKAALLEMHFLQLDPYFVAENAADLYRSLRTKGITINKANDCVIASYAIHFNLPLVHNDQDFDNIAAHTKLKIKK